MPRSGSGGSRGQSPSRSYFKYTSPKTPVPVASTPTVPSVSPTAAPAASPGFFSNMWQGFGLGAGQAIAHNIFRSNPVVTHVHEKDASATPEAKGTELPKEFVQCMKITHNRLELCKEILEREKTD
jgi:hypothetical protein